MGTEALHTDRARAESFGALAERYDRYRPGYPGELIDDLVGLRPARVLDVGCGTGKAAVALADRGLDVLGVEVDRRMADVARSHDIPVEVAAFETWADAGRRFDLITCGQCWHWIDPGRGHDKAARLLPPGGTIARFWNHTTLDEPELSTLHSAYRGHTATLYPRRPAADTAPDSFAQDSRFRDVEVTTYRWRRTYSGDEWVSLVSTFSDHQQLAPEELATLQHRLRDAIDQLGGVLHARGGTRAIFARRAG